MRFHQPRSAPSSPTLDRRPIGFTSPPKSPNGVSATTSYRKDLRLRNSNFTDTRYIYYLYYSRKQYSPLSPGSPEESDSLEPINIDLMHELRDVIFPNTPPVDRTVSPLQFNCVIYALPLCDLHKEDNIVNYRKKKKWRRYIHTNKVPYLWFFYNGIHIFTLSFLGKISL